MIRVTHEHRYGAANAEPVDIWLLTEFAQRWIDFRLRFDLPESGLLTLFAPIEQRTGFLWAKP